MFEEWKTQYAYEAIFTETMLRLLDIPYVVMTPYHSDRPRDTYDFTIWIR